MRQVDEAEEANSPLQQATFFVIGVWGLGLGAYGLRDLEALEGLRVSDCSRFHEEVTFFFGLWPHVPRHCRNLNAFQSLFFQCPVQLALGQYGQAR